MVIRSMHSNLPQPILTVVRQHADEAAHLRHVRSVLVAAPHVKLRHLRGLDDKAIGDKGNRGQTKAIGDRPRLPYSTVGRIWLAEIGDRPRILYFTDGRF